MIILFGSLEQFFCLTGKHSVAWPEALTYHCRENEGLKFIYCPVGQP
jgi:hypothetical protein